MVFPKLVRMPTEKISGELYGEGVNFDGSPNKINFEGLCEYQETSGKRTHTKDGTEVVVSAVVCMDGDICPNIPVITGGAVTVMGTARRVASGAKKYNFDHSVNFTRLELV